MTDEQFKLQIDRLKIAFGDKAFDAQRLFLIRNSLRSVTYEEFQRIVNRFMATKKPNDPPLPKDFMESAVRRAETKWQEREAKHEMRCLNCIDVGVVRVDVDGYETLAICDAIDSRGEKCGQGAWQSWKLPFANGAKTKALDWREFKPKEFTGKLSQLRERTLWWREKVKTAEEFWSQHVHT